MFFKVKIEKYLMSSTIPLLTNICYIEKYFACFLFTLSNDIKGYYKICLTEKKKKKNRRIKLSFFFFFEKCYLIHASSCGIEFEIIGDFANWTEQLGRNLTRNNLQRHHFLYLHRIKSLIKEHLAVHYF